MSYFGNLTQTEIEDAEKRKKELIFEINEQLGNLIKAYHDARYGGYVSKAREFRLLKEKLEQRMEDIRHMNLPIFLKKYPRIIKKIESENPGSFVEIPSIHRQKIVFISIIIAAMIFALSNVIFKSANNLKILVISFFISWVILSVRESKNKHPVRLEARV